MYFKSDIRNQLYEQQVLPSQKDLSYDQKEFSSKEPNMTYSPSSITNYNHNLRKDRKTFEPFKPTQSLSSGVLYDNHKNFYPVDDDEFITQSNIRSKSDLHKRRSNDLHRYDDMSPIAYRKFQQHYPDPDDDDNDDNYPSPHHHRLSLNSDRHRELPPNPPIRYRFSLQNPSKDNNNRNEKQQNQNQHYQHHHHHHGIENVHITDELRGQLPWSYFNARDDLTTAKRALSHAEEHENNDIMPPVPVPDYTYHFPRKERPSIKGGDNNEYNINNSHNNNNNHHIISKSSMKSNRNQSPNTRW